MVIHSMRLLVEVYQGLRDELGKDFTIALKLNASDFKEDGFGFKECQEIVKVYEQIGEFILLLSQLTIKITKLDQAMGSLIGLS